jgi:hypothetical protein
LNKRKTVWNCELGPAPCYSSDPLKPIAPMLQSDPLNRPAPPALPASTCCPCAPCPPLSVALTSKGEAKLHFTPPCSAAPPCYSATHFRASHRRSGCAKATSSSTARTWASSLNRRPPLGADRRSPGVVLFIPCGLITGVDFLHPLSGTTDTATSSARVLGTSMTTSTPASTPSPACRR